MPSHELITLQLGNYANFVGAHFWNLQDEALGNTEKEVWQPYASVIDHDVLYHAGEDRQGHPTYTPRVLILDLSGSQGGVSFSNEPASSYIASAGMPTWSGSVEVHHAEPVAKTNFLHALEQQADLEEEEDEALLAAQQAALEAAAAELNAGQAVRYWTDFLKAQLRPNSLYTLPGIWHGVQEFSGWGDGAAAVASSEVREAIMEHVRGLGEACDNLQGFQVLAEDLSGFGSSSAAILQELQEEYANRDVLYFSLRKPHLPPSAGQTGRHRTRMAINEGLATALLPDRVSQYIPLAVPWQAHVLPHLHYNYLNDFQTAAVLAAALDNAMLPCRLLEGSHTPLGAPVGAVNVRSLTELLRGRGGANLAAMRMMLPCPQLKSDMQHLVELDPRIPHANPQPRGHTAAQEGSAAEHLCSLHDMVHLTPHLHNHDEACLAESIVLRGPRMAHGPASTSSALAALDTLLLQSPRRCVQHRCIAPLPLPVPLPFPHIFRPSVGIHGDLKFTPEHAGPAAPSHVEAGWQLHHAQAGPIGNGSSSTATAKVDVETVPVMTKLVATSEFQQVLEQVAQRWKRACHGTEGKALLQSWDYSPFDADDVFETLQQMATSYSPGSDIE